MRQIQTSMRTSGARCSCRQVPLAQAAAVRGPELPAKGRYTIASGVEVVDLFFARGMGDEAEIVAADNAEQLWALCDELGFAGFEGDSRRVERRRHGRTWEALLLKRGARLAPGAKTVSG